MEIVIILGLILLNGVLSMSEIALVSARKSRLETDAKKGSKAAGTALKLANSPDIFLATIQIGITLVGILTGLYSGDVLAQRFAPVIAKIGPLQPYSVVISQTLIVVVVTYLTLIIGELVPKRIGMTAAEKVSKLVARPMYLFSRIGRPFVWLLSCSTNGVMRMIGLDKAGESKVTEEEIKAIIQEGAEDGEVQEVEQELVERVFNLGDRNVGSIMTHRRELVWLNISDDNEQIKRIVESNLYNAYPVADHTLDNIVGVVYLKDLFGKLDTPGFTLRQVLRPAKYIPEKLSVYNALARLKAEEVKYGIVTDEFGSVEGIVTLKDIVRALIGGMPEVGEEEEIIPREEGGYLVDGQCPFYDFLAYFDREELYNEYNYNTLSGLILDLLERIPATGERFAWKEFDFEIVDMDGARIDKVLVTMNSPVTEG